MPLMVRRFCDMPVCVMRCLLHSIRFYSDVCCFPLRGVEQRRVHATAKVKPALSGVAFGLLSSGINISLTIMYPVPP
jgi:hypothetical protein